MKNRVYPVMTSMIIKDNSTRNKNDFSSISSLINRIADKKIGLLEGEGVFVFPECIRKSSGIADEQMILQSMNDSYRSSNLMGFLGMGQERLVIQSRFSDSDQDYFLQYMLEIVLELPNILDMDIQVNRNSPIYNLLLFIFPYHLKKALRKGLFKAYIRFHYNDSNAKGTLDIAQHIKMNTPFIGKIAYSQREFSFDNHLMELVRHTIEFIKAKPYGTYVLRKVHDEAASVIEITNKYSFHDRSRILESNKKIPIRHAYFHEYRALQNLCIMILQHEKHETGSGINHIHGILFDGAWLWEEYMNTLIADKFHHPMNKAGNGLQHLFTNSNGNREGYIYPDFISKDSGNRIIADAKYKPVANIKNADYFQLLTYMLRFDASHGYYLYPERDEPVNQIYYLNHGSTYEHNVKKRNDIRVMKYGFNIPGFIDNYPSFKEAMKMSEESFKSQLAAIHEYFEE